jgi:hypothetical protein
MANDPVFGRKKGKVWNWVYTKNRKEYFNFSES